jgi:tetratricopeptide (TPR) repeat protein
MKASLCIIMILLASVSRVAGQETVFALLKNDLKLADRYFETKNYSKALELYLNIDRKTSSKEVAMKIARSHLFLKQYQHAVNAYKKHAETLNLTDLYYFAEAQSGIADYEHALESYQSYLNRIPDDPFIIRKIWRLKNIQFLFEDSSYYTIERLPLSSADGELCPVPFQNGIVFMSNRKEVQPVERLNATLNTPFYKLYFSKASQDTLDKTMQYDTPILFNKANHSGLHAGPLSFYDSEKKMVYTSTASHANQSGRRTLQLFFAEQKGGEWKTTVPFPYNSDEYSISDPAILEDGSVLYFSSDMKGGVGGKDLYKSEFIDHRWSKPVNLGAQINTPYDDVFPFIHKNFLYFSSNGHAGLGGLDIFRVDVSNEDFNEPENMGYPLNTQYDDFGIVIDSADTHGYFSSNRNSGGYNDDIYEFSMDLQSYPLEIKGLLKFKEHSWHDSTELKIMSHAKILLIDNIRNIPVYESTCDEAGNFSITIPYYSKYKMQVVGEDNDENLVSLEIPKRKKAHHVHEIVIVKEAFKKEAFKSN